MLKNLPKELAHVSVKDLAKYADQLNKQSFDQALLPYLNHLDQQIFKKVSNASPNS